jgi:flagellar biosynthetic protein FliR
MEILNVYLNRLDLLILVLVRMTGLFVIVPIFSARNIPTYVKIGLAFIISIIITSTMKPVDLTYYGSTLMYSVLIFKEFVVGVIIGFVSYLIFSSIFMAGQIVDTQIGFGMVNVFDPISNVQLPVTGNFYYIVSLLIFLMADGHHILLAGIFRSYDVLPIGTAVFNTSLIGTFTKLMGEIFIIGFKIAAPVVLAVLVTDIGLGILTKTMPQLNVYVIGMPLKIFLGLLIIMIVMPAFAGVIDVLKTGMYNDSTSVINEMVPK